MGDHRSNSADSRFHLEDGSHGTVPVSGVLGTVRFTGSRAHVYGLVLARAGAIALPVGAVTWLVLVLARRRPRPRTPTSAEPDAVR